MLALSATIAALAWLVFLVWYTLRAKWWRTPYGRNAFGVGAMLFLVMARIAASLIWPGFQELIWFGVVLYLAVAAFAVRHTYLMERAQRGS